MMICGKKWLVVLEAPDDKDAVGECEFDTRVIRVTPGPQQSTILRHEILHARLPDFVEEAIQDIEQLLYDAEANLLAIGIP